MKYKCFTIGHSNYEFEDFVEILKKKNIDSVIDVRSIPYSKYASQFNREFLIEELKKYNILYSYFGEEFGAKRTDPELLFSNGRVNFKKVLESEIFEKGIKRLKKGLEKNYTITLMCAEKDPLNCHRFVLISRGLEKNGIDVGHILEDGSVKKNEALKKEVVEKQKVKFNQFGLFEKDFNNEEILEN